MFPALSIFWSVVILFFVLVPLLLLLLTPLVHLGMWSNISAGVITDDEFARQKTKLPG